MTIRVLILSGFVALALTLSLSLSIGCGAPQGPRVHGDSEAEREANRRALEQMLSRSRDQTHPMDVLREQLADGWMARHWLEGLSPRDVLVEVTMAPMAERDSRCGAGSQHPEVCYRIERVGPAARRLGPHGLMFGDVLVHVNGRTIQRPEDLQTVLDGLDEAGELHVVILRDGELVDLRADLRDE